MLNVNQITSQLAKMPDQALQQYAAMHKNDPYILALAVSESNRRKEIRGAAQQPQGEQPKVVDQELAQMSQPMPEEVGIGALPAQNMQGMAGGGIIAFEEGGEVPRFNGQYGSVPMSYGEQMRNLGEFFNPVTRFRQLVSDPSLRSEKASAPAAAAFEIPESTITGTGSTEEVDQMAAALAAQKSAPKVDVVKPQPKPPAPGADMGLAGLAAGKGGAKSGLFQLEALPAKEDYTKEYDELYKALDEKNAKFLEGQKTKLKTDREEALYMAMIKGGLAAAGGTSKNALQNIAKGFGEGAEDFNSSLKDFRKAAQETAKIELEMQRAQADRKAGRMDKYDAKVDKAKEMALERDKALLAANTQLQAAGITAGAHVAAAKLPPKEAQMAAMLGEGKTFEERFQSGLPKLTAIQAGKFDPRKAYTEYLVAAQKSGTGEIMSFPEFAMQFAPRVSGGGSGQVLERKD